MVGGALAVHILQCITSMHSACDWVQASFPADCRKPIKKGPCWEQRRCRVSDHPHQVSGDISKGGGQALAAAVFSHPKKKTKPKKTLSEKLMFPLEKS